MLRSLRRISPLLRALLLGAVFTTATTTVTGALVGCSDPNDPQTYVDELADPMKRPAAVTRLLQFYEDAMTRDKKERAGENVKPLLDSIVPPLADLTLKGELDQRLQGDVLAFLADSRHQAALPALVKALQDYKPDDKRAEEYDTSMSEVVRNIGEMVKSGEIKDNKEINEALFKIFLNLRASTPKAQNRAFFRLLNNTLNLIADKSWEPELIKMLEKPIKSAKQKFLKDITNEVYWQITAAEILGTIKSVKAVPALIKVVLTPFKANIQTTAINALIKIGSPSIAEGVKLLYGQDEDLKKYSYDEFIRAAEDREETVDKKIKASAENSYLNSALIIIGNIGTKDCIEPMLTALDKGDKVTKSIIAAELYKLPIDANTEAKFKEVYESVSVTDKIPPDDYAKEALIESATLFFEKDLVEWLLDDSLKLKGDKPDVQGVQATILGVAIKAATSEQWHYVDELIKVALPEIKTKATKYYIKDANKKDETGPFSEGDVVKKLLAREIKQGTAREDKKDAAHKPLQDNQNFAMALHQAQYLNAAAMGKKVLDECGDKVDCYIGKIADPETNKSETAMMSEKAAYMAGLLGGPEVKMKMAELLPKVKNPSATAIILYTLINKSPTGDPEVIKKLQSYIDSAEETRDQTKIDEVKPYKQIIYRLEARK